MVNVHAQYSDTQVRVTVRADGVYFGNYPGAVNHNYMTTTHIIGWPRWMRGDVTAHPRCDDFGIEHMVSVASIPLNCTIVRLQDRTSESEFRQALTNMNDDVTCVVLSDGVDEDGTVHESEAVMLCRLGEQPVVEHTLSPLAYHFMKWMRTVRSLRTIRSEPVWLVEAGSQMGVDVEPWCGEELTFENSDVTEQPIGDKGLDMTQTGSLVETGAQTEALVETPVETQTEALVETPVETQTEALVETQTESLVETGSHAETLVETPAETQTEALVETPVEKLTGCIENDTVDVAYVDINQEDAEPCSLSRDMTTLFEHDSVNVLMLDGILPPNVFTSIAQHNSIVYLPTQSGVPIPLTRVRSAVWLGNYVVDINSWSPVNRTYTVVPRQSRAQFAPRRTVTQTHRMKRHQFERR